VNRLAVKKILILEKSRELNELIIEGVKAKDFHSRWSCMLLVAHKKSEIDIIRSTPSEIFNKNGGIDKRRQKRYNAKRFGRGGQIVIKPNLL
jgi:hypothetical protein|tara:strand:- start:3853 stop:4128 length:276 start_codon:yes stop_codon:yes gene_type:complete